MPGVDARHADRRDLAATRSALGNESWDAVVDTWSQEPAAVRDSARLLEGRVPHYTYVSSRSVYRWPPALGIDESAPVVDGDPDSSDATDYAAAKRGAELAVLDNFHGDVVLARAGLVLGPYEVVGRLPWWLNRLALGGRVPAPGPRERPLQYVDGRDLAAWCLDAARSGLHGVFNVVSEPGHTTMGALLDHATRTTGSRAELVWITPDEDRERRRQWVDPPADLGPPDGRAGRSARLRRVRGTRDRAALSTGGGDRRRHLGMDPTRGHPRPAVGPGRKPRSQRAAGEAVARLRLSLPRRPARARTDEQDVGVRPG